MFLMKARRQEYKTFILHAMSNSIKNLILQLYQVFILILLTWILNFFLIIRFFTFHRIIIVLHDI